MTMLNWPRIRCALFGHGEVGVYGDDDLTVYMCESCGQLLAVSNGNIGWIDRVQFPGSGPRKPELERVWQEWGKT